MSIVIKTLVNIILMLTVSTTGATVPEVTQDKKGVAELEAGKIAEAKAAFNEAVAADESDHAAHYYLGEIGLKEEDPDAAMKHFAAAVALVDSNSLYHTGLGRAYLAKMQTVEFMEKGRYAFKTLSHLEKAVELDERNLEARILLAHYYAKAPAIGGGDPAKAKVQIEAIKTLDREQGAALEAKLLPPD